MPFQTFTKVLHPKPFVNSNLWGLPVIIDRRALLAFKINVAAVHVHGAKADFDFVADVEALGAADDHAFREQGLEGVIKCG